MWQKKKPSAVSFFSVLLLFCNNIFVTEFMLEKSYGVHSVQHSSARFPCEKLIKTESSTVAHTHSYTEAQNKTFFSSILFHYLEKTKKKDLVYNLWRETICLLPNTASLSTNHRPSRANTIPFSSVSSTLYLGQKLSMLLKCF